MRLNQKSELDNFYKFTLTTNTGCDIRRLFYNSNKNLLSKKFNLKKSKKRRKLKRNGGNENREKE